MILITLNFFDYRKLDRMSDKENYQNIVNVNYTDVVDSASESEEVVMEILDFLNFSMPENTNAQDTVVAQSVELTDYVLGVPKLIVALMELNCWRI